MKDNVRLDENYSVQKFANGLRWRRVEEEFSRELEEHLVLLTEEKFHRGMTADEARRAARVRLGGTTQLREINRELHGWIAVERVFCETCAMRCEHC